jgi:Polyketide cyclase / dehydrase and lipid transport
MWKKLSLAVLAVLVGLAVIAAIAATRPSSYRVERRASVAAAPDVVMAEIADLKRWTSWSPWEHADPKLQRRYGGAPAGVGSTYYWSGGHSGQGRMTVVGAGTQKVEIELEIERPRPSSSDVEFTVSPEGKGTRVTWVMTGEMDWRGKVLAVLASPDRTLGADLEKGLAQLKRVAEAQARVETQRVERSTSVAAPPDVVRAHIADLHRWRSWSPWELAAPQVHRSYGGPPTGVGSSYYWSGDHVAGQGRITILRAGEHSVQVELELARPQPSSTDMEFTLVPEAGGTGTRVVWELSTTNDGNEGASGRADSALAKRVEEGLARLKAVAETEAHARTKAPVKTR